MVLRFIILATVVGAAGAVHAQTPTAAQVSPDMLHQVQVFESSLRAAVSKAGSQMAARAKEAVPDIKLKFESDIRVTSAVLSNGVVCFVEVPAIEAISAQLFDLYLRMAQAPPNSSTPRVANPVGPGAAGPGLVLDATMMTNPVKEYSEFTRQAIVDAMLDNAFAVPLKDGQTLTVVVDAAAGAPTAEIAQVSRKLYLTMRSEDLLTFRQGRITRDEARALIKESRY